jgi:hypothetical protein
LPREESGDPVTAALEEKVVENKIFDVTYPVTLHAVDGPAELISLYKQISEIKAGHLLGRCIDMRNTNPRRSTKKRTAG